MIDHPKFSADINRNNGRFFSELAEIGFSNQDLKGIKRAYNDAKYAHARKYRDDGERYFEHLRSVVRHILVAGVKDAHIIKAALLHDIVEDTGIYGNTSLPYEYWISDVTEELTLRFGSKTALIVMELTKVPYVKELDTEYWTSERIEIEGYRPILKAEHDEFYISRLSKASVDTIIVKMGDRLHNLMTLSMDNPAKVRKQIKETEEEYLPIFLRHSKENIIARNLCTKIRLQLLRLKRELNAIQTIPEAEAKAA